MALIKGYEIDLQKIQNKNEQRVMSLLIDILEEYKGYEPNQTDIEDIYALTLNSLPARYTQPVTLVIDEPVKEHMIREKIRAAVKTVRERPNH